MTSEVNAIDYKKFYNNLENKTIQEVVLERGLLTQAQLDEIFSFENLVSEVNGIQVDYVA